LWFEDHQTLTEKIQLRNLAFEAGSKPAGPTPFDQTIDGEEPNIVASPVISRAGIAQSDD
jgi:hypothetical protein